MCGIAGYLGPRGAGRIERSVAAAMTQALVHRGHQIVAREKSGFRLHPHLDIDLPLIVLTHNMFLETFEVSDPS